MTGLVIMLRHLEPTRDHLGVGTRRSNRFDEPIQSSGLSPVAKGLAMPTIPELG
jgi:hypothetical protein